MTFNLCLNLTIIYDWLDINVRLILSIYSMYWRCIKCVWVRVFQDGNQGYLYQSDNNGEWRRFDCEPFSVVSSVYDFSFGSMCGSTLELHLIHQHKTLQPHHMTLIFLLPYQALRLKLNPVRHRWWWGSGRGWKSWNFDRCIKWGSIHRGLDIG